MCKLQSIPDFWKSKVFLSFYLKAQPLPNMQPIIKKIFSAGPTEQQVSNTNTPWSSQHWPPCHTHTATESQSLVSDGPWKCHTKLKNKSKTHQSPRNGPLKTERSWSHCYVMDHAMGWPWETVTGASAQFFSFHCREEPYLGAESTGMDSQQHPYIECFQK